MLFRSWREPFYTTTASFGASFFATDEHLGVLEVPMQTGRDREVPHNFSRIFFLPFLVSRSFAHWELGLVSVLIPMNDIVMDAGMVFYVR